MLEILSHVNKRVRGHGEIKMPLDALLAQYAAPGAAPLVRNFALVYLEMAYERVSEDARLAAVRSIKDLSCKTPGPSSCLLPAVPPRGWSVLKRAHAHRTCLSRAVRRLHLAELRVQRVHAVVAQVARPGWPCGDAAPLHMLRPSGAAGCDPGVLFHARPAGHARLARASASEAGAWLA